jgi:hypothetical protein
VDDVSGVTSWFDHESSGPRLDAGSLPDYAASVDFLFVLLPMKDGPCGPSQDLRMPVSDQLAN